MKSSSRTFVRDGLSLSRALMTMSMSTDERGTAKNPAATEPVTM
jgi:hypothetical protein